MSLYQFSVIGFDVFQILSPPLMAIPRVEGTFTSSEGIPSNGTRHIDIYASEIEI